MKNHGTFLRRQYLPGSTAPSGGYDGTYPKAFYWQMIAGLAVTGRSHWYLAALIGGNTLQVRRLDRTDCAGDIAVALERVEAWWEHVATDTAPTDGAPPDWAELTADAVEAALPDLVADDIARWRQIQEQEKLLHAERDEIKTRMLAELGTHKALAINGIPLVRLVERRGAARFNRDALKRTHPALEAELTVIGPPTRFPQLIQKEQP